MTEEPIFNVKKTGEEYIVWISHLGIFAKERTLEEAIGQAQASFMDVVRKFDDIGEPMPKPNDMTTPILVSPMVKANLIAFSLKLGLAAIIFLALALISSRILPTRGLSDLADYARLVPQERQISLIRSARDIGDISRPILSEIGLGCSCPKKK